MAEQSFVFLSTGARALQQSGRGSLIQITGGSSRRAMPGKGLWAAGAFATRAANALADQEQVAEAVAFLVNQRERALTHELVVTPAGDRWVP